jgi:segregation and condensation protein B
MFDPEDGKTDQQGIPEDPQEHGISLEGLSEAFAEALGRSIQDSEEELQTGEPAPDSADHQAESKDEQAAQTQGWSEEGEEILPDSYQDGSQAVGTQADDPCPISPQTIFESMLFVGNADNRPLESSRAADLMRGVETEEIPDIVDQLNERYKENGCPYMIVAEGAGYRLRLRDRFHSLRNKFYGRAREARLSQAAIDVLAIVAYRQPITREEVNRLRSKSSNHILSQLVRRRLLRIERPAEKAAKPVYCTTDRFLELFGLEKIDELPKSEGLDT